VNKVWVIARKEIKENLTSLRYWALVGLVLVLYIVTSYQREFAIRFAGGPAGERFFFGVGNAVAQSLGLMAPILGIALGFGAIAGEREKGTIRMVLARPIFRDTLINGKVLAGVILLAVAVLTSTAIGIPVTAVLQRANLTADDYLRFAMLGVAAFLLALAYYAFALLISVLTNRSGYSLVASVGVWFFFAFILPMIAAFVASTVLGPPPAVPQGANATAIRQNPQFQAYFRQYNQISSTVQLISPNSRYSSLTSAIFQAVRGQQSNPLDVGALFAQHWIDFAVLISLFVIPLVLAYILFTRTHEAK